MFAHLFVKLHGNFHESNCLKVQPHMRDIFRQSLTAITETSFLRNYTEINILQLMQKRLQVSHDARGYFGPDVAPHPPRPL